MKLIPFILVLWTFTSVDNINCKNGTESEHECIDRIFALDDSLGKIRNHSSENTSLSQAILDYSEQVDSLNFDDCPKAFEMSFKAHIQAWRQMTAVTDKYPELRGEMHILFDQIKSGKDSVEFNARMNEIWDTWEKIERIKEKYSKN